MSYFKPLFLLCLLVALIACAEEEPVDVTPTPRPTTAVPQPTPTSTPIPFPQDASEIEYITIGMDAPSRFRAFAYIDQFGRVQGFDADVMADLAAQNFDYEFVVTSYEGLLESIALGEFDAAMSAIAIPETPPAGVTFTDPYLEVGQVMMVRANNETLLSADDLESDTAVGVVAYSHGAQTARQQLGLADQTLTFYPNVIYALQALIDRNIDAVILDHDDAEQYASNYYQQLKITGGEGRQAWLSSRTYALAVASGNTVLLDVLNQAIAQAYAEGTIDRLTRAWLIQQEEDQQRLDAGESLIGTLDSEFVIGTAALDINLDPAAAPDPLSWEVKLNTMSGLVMHNAENQLVPILASDLPTISPDKLEYTFNLRAGLTFPDGTPLTAEDVRFSILRSASFGNFLVNAFLKDANVDGFADNDAIQVLNPQTIRITLGEPTSYFLNVLATPPYYTVSQTCYATAENPTRECGGIGPYTITDWLANEQMRLKANPQWPGTPPTYENVTLRFYPDSAQMRRSLETGALDLAWIGLSLGDTLALRDQPDYRIWESPAIFKSYLVFEQDTPPWNLPQARQAAALAIDRSALAAIFEGTRRPLYSPIPDAVPGHVATQPERDLDRARELLGFVGYSPARPLEIEISYVNDGRYSSFEEAYASAIKAQLEETDVFRVTLTGAPYDTFRQQSATCNAPAFILGWPPSGQPPNYLDPNHWMSYFLFNTDTVCSNYESNQMDALLARLDGADPLDFTGRAAIYADIQTLWADEYPTLDLTQESRLAISLGKVQAVGIDAMGLLHYNALSKGN